MLFKIPSKNHNLRLISTKAKLNLSDRYIFACQTLIFFAISTIFYRQCLIDEAHSVFLKLMNIEAHRRYRFFTLSDFNGVPGCDGLNGYL